MNMDIKEFREFGKAAIDYIADYLENIRDHDVLPSVQPGYLRDLIPDEIPTESEDWRTILGDLNRVIVPGITHWQSPHFHAYYPAALSYPSIVGETLSAGFGIIGFSWMVSPVCTELEVIVMDWLAKFLNLPKHFLNSDSGPGGGIIQGSASEAVFVAVLAARETAVRRIRQEQPDLTESEIRGRLVAYASDQSNSCVEKAGLLAATPVRLIPANVDLVFRGEALQRYIQEDIKDGKIPFVCIATLGTTGTCAYDDVPSLAEVCQKYNIWIHVDAAYAGALLALPEYQEKMNRGLDLVDSLNFNLHKSLMVNFDACAMWLKNSEHVSDSFNVDRLYLKHKYEGATKIPDYRHWQIPLGRRFRSLKVWVTFRSFGAEGLRKGIRSTLEMSQSFERKLTADPRFELISKASLGLVCFRMKGDNKLTTSLLERLMERKKVYIIQAAYKGQHFLRFAICGHGVEERDIVFAWQEISEQAELVLKANVDPNNNALTGEIKDKLVGQITDNLARELHISSSSEKSKS